MKLRSGIETRNFFPVKTIGVMAVIVSVTAVMTTAFKSNVNSRVQGIKSDFKSDVAVSVNEEISNHINKDSVESVEAFRKVYKVLMSPRCMNCHPSGDVPLQGDDSHLHAMSPQRGKEGKGIYAMKCSNCHQPANMEGLHMPPGNPDWHLPPAGMKMVFQGRSITQLAKQLMDPKRNGRKNKQQLIKHAEDGLVLACWNPGEGRTLPPMSHAAFKKAWITWIEKGAYAPGSK